jgi:nitrate reductase NapE
MPRPVDADAGETRPKPSRRHEAIAFLLLSVILFPVLSIILVGGFGFVVWMQHLWFGPPVH